MKVSDYPYEIYREGKPLTEVMPNDLLILRNTNIDPKTAEFLSQTRVLFLSSEVEAIVVRDWENNHNVGIDPKTIEWGEDDREGQDERL